ncbi:MULTISPECIES: LysR family transcriptional regulator [Pseudoalteromonas]|uniref:LysR family transcriptional regulator, transcriptional activator AphB n=1 Tax=Pseudoalteromonas arctica A 37-1-2 TaxID=1117313 RepID=A0A290RYK4_9GAMM|nr:MULTISPECIES: LysR family transcriptional regulator [Pseudoalteromonas]ATC85252.1 LysR family transcriptional regulator, transcriptional activator AphB [Pseudoalteromonas arctica A 37-1-2]MDN3401205.1 LysR family transcriptional regulator [Pseudoalteromonas sp. APC 3213]PKG63508.1 LysR family transcriptional regulator [Pseudoalteromonas arctica]PKG68585.1 LysR family transcriptional regulator [Pseudoalteromonas sp. GutCa3]PKG68712.1 LysR family transcriptional regulator [Pseudoalteromonas s|tara:strand:- start:10880 stop:11767 length:888 start_codon:yes stop_codon:yes gene_type:complete
MLDNLKIFITVAELKSLTRGAESLGMTIATVSRRLHELEKKLGCELCHRSNKGLTLTNAGQVYYEETASFIHELDIRLLNLDNALNSLSGELKVMVPTNIGSGPLNEFWRNFTVNNPDILLNITLGDPDDDVISNQIDIAIRSGPQENSSLVQKKIGSISSVLVISPSYKKLLPKTVSQLKSCPSIAANLFKDWALTNDEEKYIYPKKHNHISNDMSITLNLVKAGSGIALLPMSMVYNEIENGEVERVLPLWSGEPREISLLWPKKRALSKRAIKFRDELIAFLEKQKWFNVNF